MTHDAEHSSMTDDGKQLYELLAEALALARAQLESETPDPDAWQRLAARAYAFRSALPANSPRLDELQAFAMELEHTLLARSRLESQPPQRVLFFGQTLIEARQAFDSEMTQRLMPLAEALAQGTSGGS